MSELFREHERANDVMDDASRVQTPPPRDFSRVRLINAMFTSPQICLISILAVIVEGICRSAVEVRASRTSGKCLQLDDLKGGKLLLARIIVGERLNDGQDRLRECV